jgi:hypothetical protein
VEEWIVTKAMATLGLREEEFPGKFLQNKGVWPLAFLNSRSRNGTRRRGNHPVSVWHLMPFPLFGNLR